MEKPFWLVCTTHMFLEMFLLVPIALIPVYIRDFQVSVLEASLVATVPGLVGILMNVPSGVLADKFSTRHLLFASMMIEGISALLISQTTSFWTLVLGVSVMRISTPIYHTSGLSRITKFVNHDRINRSMGFHNAFGSLGQAAGSFSLAFFLQSSGWRLTFLFWAIPIITWGIIMLRSSHLAEHRKIETRATGSKSRLAKLSFVYSGVFLTFLGLVAVRRVGIKGVQTFMTTYLVDLRGLTAGTASLIFGLGPLIGVGGSLVGGYLGEKTGSKNALSLATLGGIISMLVLAFSTQVHVLALFYVLFSLFANSGASPMATMVAHITPTTARGLGFSVYFLMEGLAGSVAPILAAGVIELFNVWHIFPFCIVFALSSMIILRFFRYLGEDG